jgi:hypothetical protein
VAALVDYVSNYGGRVFALAEWVPIPGRSATQNSVNAMNQLAKAMDSTLRVEAAALDLTNPSSTTKVNIDSPFTSGVGTLGLSATSMITYDVTSGAEGLAQTNDTVVGETGQEFNPWFIGVEQIGNGLLIISGDTTEFSDNFPVFYDENGDYDNALLARNLCSQVGLDGEDIEVAIDIKFCNDPNAFQCRGERERRGKRKGEFWGKDKRALPVTIFGTNSFDVAEIDTDTLQLCTADLSACTGAPNAESIEYDDRGDPTRDLGAGLCAVEKVNECYFEEQDFLNPDGYEDLTVGFSASDVEELVGDICDESRDPVSDSLVIEGLTLDGTPIFSVAVNSTAVDQLVNMQRIKKDGYCKGEGHSEEKYCHRKGFRERNKHSKEKSRHREYEDREDHEGSEKESRYRKGKYDDDD